MMSKQTANNLFMFSPLTEYSGFYQELLRGIGSYQHLGNRLIQLAEQAHAFRQFDKVKEIGELLSHIPVKNYQSIGYYFLAVAANSIGSGDQVQARRLFELTVETAPTEYKSKALLSLAAVSVNTGNFDSGFYYYNQTIKVTGLNRTGIEALKGIAVLQAIEGYHGHAVKALENILPLIKHAEPRFYYDFLNSYAVELGEVGRKEEAHSICKVILASPFIHAYPEWQETARDLKEPTHSFVTLEPTRNDPHNVVTMPVAEHVESERVKCNQPARVVNLQRWKTKMGKDKKENEGKPPKDLTPLQIINQIVLFYTNKNTTDEQRYKIWEAVAKIMYQPDPPEPDDEGA
jgi:hypothetical protein